MGEPIPLHFLLSSIEAAHVGHVSLGKFGNDNGA
jgi:hypothetical protein